jgi:hypothetical protein
VNREVLIVVGSLVAAVAAAAIVVAIFAPGRSGSQAAAATSTVAATALPTLIELPQPEVVAEPFARVVPAEILRTATVAAAPHAPGIKLVRTVPGREGWEDRRAEIEDRLRGDVRAYAIGDLLPYGSLLVGISTAAIDVMVGDAHLIRLYTDGSIEMIEDLEAAFEPRALPMAKQQEPEDADEVRLALIDLRSDDPTIVQAAIDRLIAAGHPGIELIVPHVESSLPVRSAEYAFPSGSQVEMRPRVVGEVAMMVLEQITGQTFGDVAREDLTAEQRRDIAESWLRFFE